MSTPRPVRVLVLRNDKLGDLTLALPAFEILKRGLAGAELWAFVARTTREVAELSPSIDRVLVDPGPADPEGSARALARQWREQRFDALLALHSRGRTSLAGLLARIPLRVSPASQLHHFLHNERVVQRRSRSLKPEFAYNVDLARHLCERLGGSAAQDFTRPVLRLDPAVVAARRAALRAELGLAESQHLIVVHPGHGGSSTNLTLEQYARLVIALDSAAGHAFLITAGPGELAAARELGRRLGSRPHAVHESTAGLAAFAVVLASADLAIGSSTGPLHLAGALDVPTVVFYIRRASGSCLRWQTLGSDSRRLAFTPPPGAPERDLSTLDLSAAAAAISGRFLRAPALRSR